MRGLLLASVALMAGPAVPPKAPPPPEQSGPEKPIPEKPCPEREGEPRPVVTDRPSDAQRFNPGLF
jgi:hypothetical protein